MEEEGLFSLAALHTILPTCHDVPAVIAHLTELPVNAYGFSLMVADANGELALLEKTNAGLAVLQHHSRQTSVATGALPMAHTNTVLDPTLAAAARIHPPEFLANSNSRYATACEMLSSGSSIDQILISRASGQQGGAATSISQSGDDGLDLHTDFAVVLSPVERSLWLYGAGGGAPHEQKKRCRGPERIDVAALLGF